MMFLYRYWEAFRRISRRNVVPQFLLAVLLPLLIVWNVDPVAPLAADEMVYDWGMAAFPPPAESAVEIISIDDESLKKLGPWPWPESVHTRFLQQLAKQAPKAVVLNFRLGVPMQTGDDDVALGNALRLAPVFLQVRDGQSAALLDQNASLRFRTRRFAPVAQGIGHANLASWGTSESVRFIRLFSGKPDSLLPYLGALVGPSPEVRQAVANTEQLRIGAHFRGGTAHSSTPYFQVLEGNFRPDQFKGRTVLVGPSLDSGIGLPMYVAGEKGAVLVSSIEVHASFIDSLQHGTQVAVATPFALYACLAVFIWISFFLFETMSKAAPLVGIVGLGVAVLISLGALRFVRVWIPPSFFGIGIGAAYVLWTWQHMNKVLGFLKAHIVSLSQVPAGTFDPGAPPKLGGSDTIDRYIGALDHAILRLVRLQTFTQQGLERLPIAILICRLDGTISQLNAAAMALLPESLVGSLVNESLPLLVKRMTVNANVRHPGMDGHWTQALGGEYSTPQGKIFQIDAARLGDPLNQAPGAWIVVLLELTQQRQAERERADWLNFLWHDLRSPQINLLSLLELFEMKPSRMGVAELVSGVRHEAERTMTLAQNFISSSTSEARDYRFSVASLSSLLAQGIEALVSSAKARNVRVLVSSANGHPDLVRADGGMLTRAFVNVLENAIRHSPSGATIRVRCIVETDREAVATIHDEGTGMSAAKLDNLLARRAEPGVNVELEGPSPSGQEFEVEPADREPPHDPNHGFGFAMVRQVVAAHGGWISGWSVPGVGTTFAIGFPLANA
ncbi:CHASE2 domain-containing protein [Variovorax sp. LG9.2]|uniref:CHASE2 domain-containing protein n=1 Tax=Variovorax sp. LG9.2 TaxID=3048626 RepID=UPI002B237AA3|nr:CHASE2 domain-containing protein [Variovorax sp. LG9.2]